MAGAAGMSKMQKEHVDRMGPRHHAGECQRALSFWVPSLIDPIPLQAFIFKSEEV